MRSTRAFRTNLALTLIAVLVSAGIGELIVRCCVPVRNVGPSFTVYDPLYGKALKKSFFCRRITPEFTMNFTTNAEGFRGPAMEPLFSQSIIFLGDSFTMGYGVNDGEEFPALVRRALNERSPYPASIINAGVGNNGNGRWVKFLRADAEQYTPDLVVFQIHDNDFQDNMREQLFEITSDGGLRECPLPPPGARWALQRVVEGVPGLSYSYLIGFARQVFWDRHAPRLNHGNDPGSRDDISEQTESEDHLMISILDEALRICEEEEWETLAVIVDVSGQRLTKLKELFSARHIPAIVIPTKQERPDLYYKVDGHWNALGQRYAADRILERLNGHDEF